MVLQVFEVLQKVKSKRNKAEKVEILKQNASWALKDLLRGSMDSTVKWNLPGGEPPYAACEAHSHPTSLLRENVKFKYFVKGGAGDRLPAVKREKIFIGMLEGVHPEDAKLLVKMINKETPDGISRPIVEEAFPGLLRD